MSPTSAMPPRSRQLTLSGWEESSSSPAARPAPTTPSPASEREWMERMVASSSSSLALLLASVPPGSSWRTYLDSCRAGADGTLAPSLGRWGNAGFGTPTGFWTAVTGESHSGAAASSLSRILEAGPHLARYSLTSRACAGILRRAAKRGRALPPALEQALRAVADQETDPPQGSTSLAHPRLPDPPPREPATSSG
jgi:hypothetical protein